MIEENREILLSFQSFDIERADVEAKVGINSTGLTEASTSEGLRRIRGETQHPEKPYAPLSSPGLDDDVVSKHGILTADVMFTPRFWHREKIIILCTRRRRNR
jgi:hypothetical protein